MTISATATGCLNLSSRVAAKSRRPARGRPSRRVNSSSAIPTRTAQSPIARCRRSSPATAAIMAYRRLEEHVGRFRDFLHEHGETPEQRELVAAKLMGRWRSGAPLVLRPTRTIRSSARIMQRNNDFNYKEMDPHGYAVPLGSHARRMNPRDTAANMNRRRMIRRGATYGPYSAGRGAGGRRRARHCGVRDLRQPHSPVRIRAERLGERPKFSRTRQRTRPDHRRPGRHVRVQDSEAPDPQKDRRVASLHHCQRRGLFLSAGT